MRKIKKLTAVLVCVAMLCAVLPCVSVSAATSGTCGDNLTWTLDSDGTLTISGTGTMTDWSSYSKVPWYMFSSSITAVSMENGVTSIGNRAFSGCSRLTSITIPGNVTSIGRYAFRSCASLASINVSEENLNYADTDGILFDKDIIKLIQYPAGKTDTEYEIPDGVTSIDMDAFYDCIGLTSVTIPNSVTSIGESAFKYCRGLTSVTIGNSVTNIGDEAFSGCTGLTSIIIPDSVTSIGESAFEYCRGLTSVTIGNSVTSIGEGVFYDCIGLTSVDYNAIDCQVMGSRSEPVFENCSSLKEINIGEKVTNIPSCAFSCCTALISITIPDSVTSIGSCAFSDGFVIGTDLGCISLTSIIIPSSVTSIGNGAFSGCSGLTSVIIPNSITEIADFIFRDCNSLTSITIPNRVTSIGEGAFDNCESLTKVTIPDNVTSIGNYAFCGCSSLTSISIPDSVTSIGEGAFSECIGLTSVTIPENVNSIGNHMFFRCTGLTSVTMSGNVTSIGDWAFGGCTNLTSVTIPDNVTSIGDWAFHTCTGLTNLIIGNSVANIGDEAFSQCTSLTSIDVSEENMNYADIDGVLFNKEITALVQYPVGNSRSEYNIPDSVTSIGGSAFEYCTGLTSVTIPGSVTSINEATFYDCTSLTSVSIPDSVTSIGDYAFEGCSSLTDVYYSGSEEQWNAISISSGNSCLKKATIHYNSAGATGENHTSPHTVYLWLNANGITATYLGIGQTYQSGIQAYPLTDYPTGKVTWHSADPQIAVVSQSGDITGISEGSTSVYVTTADGISSDAMSVVVTDLSRFSKTVTATDKVNKIGFGSNYEWISSSKNFLYWQAWLNNDSNAGKYYFQNYICAPLFDLSEMKNLYSGECSVQRAKEILLSFIYDTYDETFSTVKTDFSYKLGKQAAGTLAGFLEAYVDKSYGEKLKSLGEDNIIAAFEGQGYDGGINTIANYINPDDPDSVAFYIGQWAAADTVNECFSVLSKVINLKNTVASIGNEIMAVEIAAQTNKAYCDMLDYLALDCISENVRRAAADIKSEMNNTTTQNIVKLSGTVIASKAQDAVIKKAFKTVFKAVSGGSFIIKLGKDLGVFVSNELLHAKDTLKCTDNIRLLSYMSASMVSRLADIHSRFLTESDAVKKEAYAKSLIEQYNLLVNIRKLGEENFYKTYNWNPANWEIIRNAFGKSNSEYDEWYTAVMKAFSAAKGNPEAAKTAVLYSAEAKSVELFSADDNEALSAATEGTQYSESEFYALFADKGLADAVLYSLGTDSEDTDWSIVTHEAVSQLDFLCCDDDNSVFSLDGISNLVGLSYIDLSDQCVESIPEEITDLENLKRINLFNNGLAEYPSILNDVPAIEFVGLGNNLLTEYPEIKNGVEIDVSGNLLNPGEYTAQRYLCCDMPVIYDADSDVCDIVRLKDIYGCEYDYNGDNLYIDGVRTPVHGGIGVLNGSVTLSVNGSKNPNAHLTVTVDISEGNEYTESEFHETFPDEQLRNAVLTALGMDSDNADYSRITPATLAGISDIYADGAENLAGIEKLKGLNKLSAINSKFDTLPEELTELKNLQVIILNGSNIVSLEGISSLEALNTVGISECVKLKDISDLMNCAGLESLYADGLSMSDILNTIQEISTIKSLSVSGNLIENIDGILGHNFNYLNIKGNYIDEAILKDEYLPQLTEACRALAYSPQIGSLICGIAIEENNVTATIENTTGAVFENVSLIVAYYRNGSLVGCKTQNIPLIAVDEVLKTTMILEDLQPTDKVTCYMWQSVNSMSPISRPK